MPPLQGSYPGVPDSRGLRPWLFPVAPLGLKSTVPSVEEANHVEMATIDSGHLHNTRGGARKSVKDVLAQLVNHVLALYT